MRPAFPAPAPAASGWEQGDPIGYVGNSDAATGPHLHYAYRVNGIHKNPRTVRLPNAAPIPAESDFQSKTGVIRAQREQAQDTTIATAPAD